MFGAMLRWMPVHWRGYGQGSIRSRIGVRRSACGEDADAGGGCGEYAVFGAACWDDDA
jgi:hypothetical protein